MQEPQTSKPKILAVDDVETNLLFLKAILKELDIDVYTSSSGMDALSLVDEHQFAAVLLDVQMPEMDGYEVAQRISGNEKTRNTPIIFITASNTAECDLSQAYRAGAVDFLEKPVNRMILRSKVNVFVELQRKQNELEATARKLQETVDQLERSESRLEQVARHDQLTGLANRRYFLELLGSSIDRSRRTGKPVGLISLDLDGFKAVNDKLGHDAGDLLLKKVAERMKACVRTVDAVARLGGDEFCIVLEGMAEPGNSALVAGRLIQEIARPYSMSSKPRLVTASIGISSFPADARDIDGLLKCADIAMYEAKKSGKCRYCFFDREMTAAMSKHDQLVRRLGLALEQDEFRLHYQPQLDLGTSAVIGFEALLRWERDGELIPPFEFISALEESGLIIPVGEWVIRSACKQIRRWQESGLPPFRVSVNISARQFRDRGLASLITRALQDEAVEGHFLEIELTESLVMEDTGLTVSILEEVKEAGVRISVDDFGTGHSSLAFLKRFPLDVIKVDRTFVNDVPDDADSCAIARAIIKLAHNLRLKVIAEGVETEEQLQFLIEQGCDGCQGFLFSKPRPPEDFIELFEGAALKAMAS